MYDFILGLGKRRSTRINSLSKVYIDNMSMIRRLRIEHLESRELLSTIIWNGESNPPNILLSDGENWNLGRAPTDDDDVLIANATTIYDLDEDPILNSIAFLSSSIYKTIENPIYVYDSLTANGGTGIILANVCLVGNPQNQNMVEILSTSGMEISGNISSYSPGVGGILKTGGSYLTLSGANNTYSGGTTINAGTLELAGLS
jgi:autotransporter-associated beta strand protein